MQYNLFIDKVDERVENGNDTIVVIDGMAAAGKSTLAAELLERYTSRACNVIPMDHFFLRPQQRTPERFVQPGGNIDYERFAVEIAGPLEAGTEFSYRPFDCMLKKLSQPVAITPKPLTIVEGVYSYRCMRDILHISIFMKVDDDIQRSRLLARGPALYERFINEWLPLENRYFKHYAVEERSDYIICG